MAGKMMDDLRSEARELVEKLRTERDELHLKVKLGSAEVRDEWEKLEPKWAHFQARAHAAVETAEEASRDVGSALGLLGEELQHGYARIRKALKS